MNAPFPHCPWCGERFAPRQKWPRTCRGCGQVSFLNPLPVAVVILPVDEGLLAVRRTIEPGLGELALPGGYVSTGETWQEGAAREIFEETGIRIDPGEVEVFRVATSPEELDKIVVFGLARPRRSGDLPEFAANEEAGERVVIDRATRLAFSLHEEVARAFFDLRGTE